MRRIDFALATLGLLGLGLTLGSAPAAAQQVAPWTEAVVSVRDIPASTRLFRQVGGWRMSGSGTVTSAELRYWDLRAGARARFERWCAPGAATGCIRFVQFADAGPQRPIRLAARPWDTGGIFSIMLRTTNAQAVFDRAIALGWWAETEPYKFGFGGSDLVNVVLTGPDGFNVALYQRNSPPFTEFPLGLMSRAFNAMRMVRDQRASVAWYRDRLGFSQAFDQDYRDPAPGPTNFSIPHNLAPSIARCASAMHPVPNGSGRIEIMQFVGFTGKDVSAFAHAPNFGILSVRYPVDGLTAFRTQVEARGVTPAQAGTIAIAGRPTAAFAVRDPDGNLTEFYDSGSKR